MIGFSKAASIGKDRTLIPKGTIAWGVIEVNGIKNSKATDGSYLDLSITIVRGPHEGRKIFEMIPNIFDERNSEKWRDMGTTSLTRILEGSGVFNPADETTYGSLNHLADLPHPNESAQQLAAAITGSTCGVKIGIDKGEDGHAPKNRVNDFFTPNTESNGFKGWENLLADKDLELLAAEAPAFTPPVSAFTQPAAAPVPATPPVAAPPAPAAAPSPAAVPAPSVAPAATPPSPIAGGKPPWMK